MATVTPIASVRGILDAANDAAATESVLALLADANIQVASIDLQDATGLTLPVGSLSLNANSKLVIHDNNSNTEDLNPIVDSLDLLTFGTRVLSSQMNNVTLSRKLGEFMLTPSKMTNAKSLFISGETFASWEIGNKPDSGVFLAIIQEGQNPLEDGFNMPIALGVTSESRRFLLPMYFSVASSVWTLSSLNSISSSITAKNNSGTIVNSADWEYGTDWVLANPITGPAGSPMKFEIYLVSIDSSNTVLAKLHIAGKMSIISE